MEIISKRVDAGFNIERYNLHQVKSIVSNSCGLAICYMIVKYTQSQILEIIVKSTKDDLQPENNWNHQYKYEDFMRCFPTVESFISHYNVRNFSQWIIHLNSNDIKVMIHGNKDNSEVEAIYLENTYVDAYNYLVEIESAIYTLYNTTNTPDNTSQSNQYNQPKPKKSSSGWSFMFLFGLIFGAILSFQFCYVLLSGKFTGSPKIASKEAASQILDLQNELNKVQYENDQLESRLEVKKNIENARPQFDNRKAAYNYDSADWVTKTYTWTSSVDRKVYSFDMDIDKNAYDYYGQLGRYELANYKTQELNDLPEYFKDELNLCNIRMFVNMFKNMQDIYNWTDSRVVEEVIACIQNFTYTLDKDFDGKEIEYPKYAIETLYDKCGDCEDTAMLTAMCLRELGYDVAVVVFVDHMGVGINVDYNMSGAYFTSNDKNYYYIETTSPGYSIGTYSSELTDKQASVFPLDNIYDT